MTTQRREDGSHTELVFAHVLERLMTEFIADVQAWGGPHIDDQRDPGGRIVSYGYHWHEPDNQGICENWIVYGYLTPLAALSAAFHAKLTSDQLTEVRNGLGDRLIMRCKIQA